MESVFHRYVISAIAQRLDLAMETYSHADPHRHRAIRRIYGQLIQNLLDAALEYHILNPDLGAECPHCGYVHEDPEWFELTDVYVRHVMCDNCFKPFIVERHIRTTYDTRKAGEL